MKDIVRLAITLMIICAIAAGALAYTNQVTSVIIENRIAEAKVAEMRKLFPTVDRLEDKTVDGRTGTVGFDADGNFVGVLAEGRTGGYAGDIRFNLAVNAEGKIVGLSIVQHSETAGLGAKIKEDWFIEQFIGKDATDSFDVDNISGATVSTRAMESGVEKELGEILLRFSGVEGAAPAPPSFSLDGVADGKYTGTAKGFGGDLTVEVTVAGGKMTKVEVVENKETPAKFELTQVVIDKIIETQTVQVDAASGATVSSDAIMKAVTNALTQ